MPDNIIKRAARAVEQLIGSHCENCETPIPSDPHEIARAVLQAIREPSEAMKIAGHGEEAPSRQVSKVPNIWQAMIDAALADA